LSKKEVSFEDFEEKLLHRGLKYIAGVDEAGLGALAGPVVAASVIFKPDEKIKGLNDSKKLTPKKREDLFHIIKDKALCYSLGIIDVEAINKTGNILASSLTAMKISLAGLKQQPEHVLIDGKNNINLDVPSSCIIKGDQKCFSIAAASILAKVHRDNLMCGYSDQFEVYEFDRHKGYATAVHIKAIRQYGPCPLHRTSYDFIKGLSGDFTEGYYRFEKKIKTSSDLSRLDEMRAEFKNDKVFSDIEIKRLKKRIKSRYKFLKNRRS
jgi:ribonuclease HII